MVDEQTWSACMDSEIFREFVSQELKKEADWKAGEAERLARSVEHEIETRHTAYAAFDEFERQVRSSPALMAQFRQVKKALAEHPELAEKVDKNFIEGIMMLDLDEE